MTVLIVFAVLAITAVVLMLWPPVHRFLLRRERGRRDSKDRDINLM